MSFAFNLSPRFYNICIVWLFCIQCDLQKKTNSLLGILMFYILLKIWTHFFFLFFFYHLPSNCPASKILETSWSLDCSIYLMNYVNKSPSSTRVSSPSADSAFFVDFGAGQIRFVPYIVGIYFVRGLITMPVLQHNLQRDGRLKLIC